MLSFCVYCQSCQGTSTAAMSDEAAGDGEQGVGGEDAAACAMPSCSGMAPSARWLRGLLCSTATATAATTRNFAKALPSSTAPLRGEEAAEAPIGVRRREVGHQRLELKFQPPTARGAASAASRSGGTDRRAGAERARQLATGCRQRKRSGRPRACGARLRPAAHEVGSWPPIEPPRKCRLPPALPSSTAAALSSRERGTWPSCARLAHGAWLSVVRCVPGRSRPWRQAPPSASSMRSATAQQAG